MTAVHERTWVAVCGLADLVPGRGVAALLPGAAQAAVFLVGSDVYAVSNVDPFSGAAVLSRGIVGDLGGVPVVASPVYKQHFDLRTGACLDDGSVAVAAYPVRVEGGTVLVGAP